MADPTTDKPGTPGSGEAPEAKRSWAIVHKLRKLLSWLFAIEYAVPEDERLKTWYGEARKTHQAAELDAAKSLLKGISPGDGGDAAARRTDLKSVQERLYRMIDYAIRRHDWYSDQCHRLLQVGLALIAAAAAVAAVLTKVGTTGPHPITWLVPVVLALGGLVQVLHFNSGLAGSYPYRKLSDILSWYYYYRVGSQAGRIPDDPTEAKAQVETHSTVITKYFGAMAKHLASPADLLREDLEQVSILFLLQGYKRDQVKAMSRWLTRTVWALLVVVTVSAALTARGYRAGAAAPTPQPPLPAAQTPTPASMTTPATAPPTTPTPGVTLTPAPPSTRPTTPARKQGRAPAP